MVTRRSRTHHVYITLHLYEPWPASSLPSRAAAKLARPPIGIAPTDPSRVRTSALRFDATGEALDPCLSERARGAGGGGWPAVPGARGWRGRRVGRVPLRGARREQDLRAQPVGGRHRSPCAGAALCAPEPRAGERGQRGQSLDHLHLLAWRRRGRELPLQGGRVTSAPEQPGADRPRVEVRVFFLHQRVRWQAAR